MIKADLLTDEDIIDYSGSNVLTEYKDVNLKYTNWITPYKGGVYDPQIFGSLFKDQCLCGRVKTPNKKCVRCSTEFYEGEELFNKYARVELPYYYLNFLRHKEFKKFLLGAFTTIEYDCGETFFSGNQKMTMKLLDTVQFEFDIDSDKLIATDKIDNAEKCSYEGLYKIFNEQKKSFLSDFLKLVNKTVLVTPIVLRPLTLSKINGETKLSIHPTSAGYQSLIYVGIHAEKLKGTWNNQEEEAYSRAVVRKYINNVIYNLSSLLKTSKQNIARTMFSKRLNNSGRAAIVADPKLDIDEITLPTFMAFEIFKDEFKKHLVEYEGRDPLLVDLQLKEVDPVLDLFKEWVVDRVAILNRAPTLHEYNLQSFKVRLNDNYTIGFPIMVCGSYAADFDGDTLSVFAVPESIEDMVQERMSPRNTLYYKKSLSPIYTPSHEVLNGLALATKMDNDQEVIDYSEYSSAEKDEFEGRIDIYTPIRLNGEITTVGRVKINEIMNIELNKVLGDNVGVSSANVRTVIDALSNMNDRVERLGEMQRYVLELITIYGVTTPSVSEVYKELPRDFYDQIKDIDESDIDPKEKLIKIEEIYKDYLQNAQDTLGSDLIERVKESDRIKVSQLLELLAPQMYYKEDGTFHVNRESLLTGLSYEDYVKHSVHNRMIQDIKVSSVPIAGYLTRQFIYLGYQYIFKDIKDEENSGLLIPAKAAEGRTAPDGKIYSSSNSDDLVPVVSVITSKLNQTVTPDMVNLKMRFNDLDKAGMSMISSFTENLTQRGLALKHGAKLTNLDKDNAVYAPNKGTYRIEDEMITFTSTDGLDYQFKLPNNFSVREPKNGSIYEKGEVLGFGWRTRNPSYNLDAVIKVVKGSGSNKNKEHEKNDLIIADRYALADGEVKFEADREANFIVSIGGKQHVISKNLAIYVYNGQKVKKGDIISAGLVNIDKVVRSMGINDSYLIFRSQIIDLIGGMTEEIMELVFRLLLTEDSTLEKPNFAGLTRKLNLNDSFYASLSFKDARKAFERVISGKSEIKEDVFTKQVLNLFL